MVELRAGDPSRRSANVAANNGGKHLRKRIGAQRARPNKSWDPEVEMAGTYVKESSVTVGLLVTEERKPDRSSAPES